MTVIGKDTAANQLTAGAIVIAVAVPLWERMTEYGWLAITFGRLSPVFWGLVLVWILCVVSVLRQQRRWWLLITAPSVLYPVVMAALLIVECTKGTCL